MTSKQIIAARKKHLRELDRATKAINKKWYPIIKQYIKHNSPVKIGKVYEVISDVYTPRGCKRFVVYALRPKFFPGNSVLLVAGGWWLDENNVPKKWHSYPVSGTILNPTKFKLSTNQANEKHPKYERK